MKTRNTKGRHVNTASQHLLWKAGDTSGKTWKYEKTLEIALKLIQSRWSVRDRWKFTYIGTFARTDHDSARALVEWMSRRALHCPWWDKHLLSSGLSKTEVWFSSKKSCRWRRKMTECPCCSASESCSTAKLSFAKSTWEQENATTGLFYYGCCHGRISSSSSLRRSVRP